LQKSNRTLHQSEKEKGLKNALQRSRLFVMPTAPPEVSRGSWGEQRDAPSHIQQELDMKIEHQIDELIKAGWKVVESDFDPLVFQHWRLQAFKCINAMLGSDHFYTKYFEQLVQQGDRVNVLAAGGVLATAKQQWVGKEFEPSEPLNSGEVLR
jgi:hypothetical protein